jgi:hypothetical protein
MSTYMSFTTISARALRRAPHLPELAEGDRRVRNLALAARDYKLAVWDTLGGTVYPARAAVPVLVQARVRRRWRTILRLRVARDGSYHAALASGSYRIVYGQVAGPTVTIG